ncbi:MAG: GTPase ObgE [Rickettsiaceae bacterium]
MIDETKIYIKAGNGGDGCVSFRREKFIPKGGPNGGDGGNGGAIIFRANVNINTLIHFRYKQHFKAKNGSHGQGSNKTGKSAEALILEVPIGTQIFSEDGNIMIYDFIKHNEEFIIIKGGKGGLGNSRFKSSKNQTPYQHTKGEIGEEMSMWLKLKYLSDVGLVGLPNAGKSTLLSVLTSAKPKIANYPFTTLKPMLGVVEYKDIEFVIADIPGLIQNAHLGQGLGHRFLKHIERCKILLHVIDITSANISQDYNVIQNELKSYSNLLMNKEVIILLNKCDLLEQDALQDKINQLNLGNRIFTISAKTKKDLKNVLEFTVHQLKNYESKL